MTEERRGTAGDLLRGTAVAVLTGLAALVVLVRIYSLDGARLLPDMRELQPASVDARGREDRRTRVVADDHRALQEGPEARRVFRSVLGLTEFAADGGASLLRASYPSPAETACLSVYLSGVHPEEPEAAPGVEFVWSVQGVHGSMPFSDIGRSHQLVLRELPPGDGTVHVEFGLSDGADTDGPAQLPVTVSLDYLDIWSC